MITKNSLIFIVEDDKPYGSLLKNHLKKIGYQNVMLFHDEKDCLNNMGQNPKVLISDYNLNYMSGLKLIQEARAVYPGFYSILLSGAFHNEKYSNDMPVQNIDKYLMKGDNELQKLSDLLCNLTNSECNQQFY